MYIHVLGKLYMVYIIGFCDIRDVLHQILYSHHGVYALLVESKGRV